VSIMAAWPEQTNPRLPSRARRCLLPAMTLLVSLCPAIAFATELEAQRYVQLSPDGKLISYIETVNRVPYLWVAHSHNPADRKPLTLWDARFQSYSWSANSSQLVFQRREGDGKYALGVLPVDQGAPATWYEGRISTALRGYARAEDGSLVALEIDDSGVRVTAFPPDKREGIDRITLPRADDALINASGELVAYHRAGRWYFEHLGSYREVTDMRDALLVSADKHSIYAIRSAKDGGTELISYARADGNETILTKLPAGTKSIVASDASARIVRTDHHAQWQAVDASMKFGLSYAMALDMTAIESIQLSDDGKTWLLTLAPSASPKHANYAIYYHDSAAFTLLFGPGGSSLGSAH